MDQININVSIAGHIEYAAVYLIRYLQATVAWLPTVFVKVMIFDAKNRCIRVENCEKIYLTKAGRETSAEKTFDELFWRHRIWHSQLGRLLLKVQALLRNDCVNGKEVFDRLFYSSIGSKHIGLVHGKMIANIQWLGRESKDGIPWDFHCIREISSAGNFVLISHSVENDVVVCNCVWLTGPNSARVFKVTHDHAGTAEGLTHRGRSASGITGMYIPPAPVRWLGGVLKYFLAASAFLGATKVLIEFFRWLDLSHLFAPFI